MTPSSKGAFLAPSRWVLCRGQGRLGKGLTLTFDLGCGTVWARLIHATTPHGVSKRRTWRKLHVGVDEATGEILSAVVTANSVHDSEVLGELLDGTDASVEQVSGDGAYDTRHCYEHLAKRGAKAIIPPRKNARIWRHGNCKGPPHGRDENLRFIRKHGRKKWKRQSRYHRRSLAETTMFRFKTTFGGQVKSRTFKNQVSELRVQCAVLNRMIQVAKPVTEWRDD